MTSDSAYYSSVVPPFVKELRVAIPSYSDSDLISYRGLLSSEFLQAVQSISLIKILLKKMV